MLPPDVRDALRLPRTLHFDADAAEDLTRYYNFDQLDWVYVTTMDRRNHLS